MRPERLAVILGAVLLLSAAPVLSREARHNPRVKSASSRTKSRTKKASAKRRRRERAQKAPTPERIREIQSALAREGTYTHEPNGKWDDPSAEAMKHYQAAHGLNPTGKLDALTLQKLGLGSEVAGVAAPRPTTQPPSSMPLRPQ